MVKIKMKLSLVFSTCFLAVMVFGDLNSSNNNLNPNPNPNPSPVENSKTLQDRILELENSQKISKASHEESQEEVQNLKTSFEKSQEEIKSLKEEVEKLKQVISEDHSIGMLRPPVRGPPGRKGESGIKGEMGNRGPAGSHGQPGGKGEKGAVGSPGQTGPKGNSGLADPQSIRSCSEAMKILPFASQRISTYPNFCDFETDGGGWTTIQKRSSGPRNEFNRNWNDYVKGFGSLDKNFWIGLENIRTLTKNGDQELRIDLEDFEGEKRYAKYSSFSISDASDFYRLSISGYSGDVADDMIHSSPTLVHHGMRFSTPDKDNDKSSSDNCALDFGGGGWWFNRCHMANLNGHYVKKGETFRAGSGIMWETWKGDLYSLAKTEMKIRTRK